MFPILVMIGILAVFMVDLFAGLTIGFAASKARSLAATGIGLLLGSLIWLSTLLFPEDLRLIPFLTDAINMLDSVSSSFLIFGNGILTASLLAIFLFELGYFSGYASARRHQESQSSQISSRVKDFQKPGLAAGKIDVKPPIWESSEIGDSEFAQSASQFRAPAFKNLKNNLTEDEKTLAELFVTGKVSEVVPKLSDTSVGGVYFEQLNMLGWDTPRQALALDLLAAGGFLFATPKEKIIHCRQCDSTNLQYSNQCPACGSINVARTRVLEHFPCGVVEKEEVFRNNGSDLVCPKCCKKLELIGRDYRSLGHMYGCFACGELVKDLTSVLRCRNCQNVGPPESQKEKFLFSYTLNKESLPRLRKYIKPTEDVSEHLRVRGFVVFSPVTVRGKSGTEHTFDLMAISKPTERSSLGKQVDESARTVFEIISSDSIIELEEISRVYGKINDVQYDSVILVISTLTEDARNYARVHGMKIVEGTTIEQALQKLDRALSIVPIDQVGQ